MKNLNITEDGPETSTIRMSPDGSITMVDDGRGNLTIALQCDIDTLECGPDLTEDEINGLES